MRLRRRSLARLLRTVPRAVVIAGLALAPSLARGDHANSPDATLQALRHELRRATQLAQPGRTAPSYVGYWLVDTEEQIVEAQLGALVTRESDQGRYLQVELRVGNHELDNSNYLNAPRPNFQLTREGLLSVPQDNQPEALRRLFWLTTDEAYRHAHKNLDAKRASRASEVSAEARPPDFSQEPAHTTLGPSAPALPPLPNLEQTVQDASRVFLAYPDLQESWVGVDAQRVERTFISSEGVHAHDSNAIVEFNITCRTQADDGMPLSHSISLFSPTAQQVKTHATRLAQELRELRTAPLVSDYSGPVLFEGVAAAQIAQDLLGQSLSGTPVGGVTEGPFARKLGKRVMPRGFTIIDDPSLQAFGDTPLLGHYLFDDEGTKAERVTLVSNGRLRGYLMSRTPRTGFTRSNGHGRSGLSHWARGGVGNLIVRAQGGLTERGLRQTLQRALKDEGLDYGLIVRRLSPQSYASGGQALAQPERVFKWYRDGREELVRGAEIAPFSVRELRNVIVAGRDASVYNYTVTWPSGLRSASSVVAPGLLFEDLEINKFQGSHRKSPAYPRPTLKTEVRRVGFSTP